MDTPTQAERPARNLQISRWNLASRVAFRFCFVYLGLFCLTTQIITSLLSPNQGADIPDPATLWPLHELIVWTAAHILNLKAPLDYDGNSGSGDGMFGWVLVFCLLIISALATGIWHILDRRRGNYLELQKWFRLFIRFSLAGQMLNYGIAKVIPLQMPYPYLTTLIQPFGTFSPMKVLWSSIGASSSYEIFAGCVEVFGGLLLIVPRTATFGALICLVAMTQVFMLNMTYDVPVKLFSFHLILLSVFLLAPDIPRLFDVFLDRPVAPSRQPQLFSKRRANRIALTAQILLGIWLIGMNAYSFGKDWYIYGGGRPNSPLYGIWEVNEMSIDQQLRSPILTDSDRWRRAIFDFPTSMAFQRMDDSFARFNASINVNDKTIALTKYADREWKANFAFQRATQDRLILDGKMDNHQIHMVLRLIDRNKFLLVTRGFHWIQEGAFNR